MPTRSRYDAGMPFVLLLLWSIPLQAQFTELSTTDDGTQLYFSSPMRIGASQPASVQFRIYRVAKDGVELFAEPSAPGPLQPIGGANARTPQVTGDGQSVGLTMTGVCPAQGPCTSTSTQAELRGASTKVLGQGSLRLSRNGRWAVLAQDPAGPPPPAFQSILIDLTTGQQSMLPQSNVPPPTSGGLSTLTSDGGVLTQAGVWRQGKLIPIPSGLGRFWGISDNARVVITDQLTGGPPTGHFLGALDLVTGAVQALDQRGLGTLFLPMGLSNDGRVLLYRTFDPTSIAGPAYIRDTTTGVGYALLLPAGETATDGTLSGDGSAAYLVTTAGKIVRIGLGNAPTLGQVIGATPYASNVSLLAPGSLFRLNGSLPRDANGLRGKLFINGIAAPVVYANDREIGIQVPWEAIPNPQSSFRVDVAGDSPFRQNDLIPVLPAVLRFEPLSPGESDIFPFKFLRGDFSGLLTTNPQPGDSIVVYATGLGAVSEVQRTGQPAPLDHAVPIQGQIHCRFTPYSTDAETLFAGLAPGLVGFYQINFRLPQGPDPGKLTGGSCSYAVPGGGGSFGWSMFGGVGLVGFTGEFRGD